MAMTFRFSGTEELGKMLEEAGRNAQGVAALALYDGAGVMADAISASIGSIETEPFDYASDGQTRKPSPEEKAALTQGAAGIAKFDKNGAEVSTSVGFKNAGYAMIKGRRVPIPVIANAINSGTSFMTKQPFFRRAVSKATGPATAAITARGEQILNDILGK